MSKPEIAAKVPCAVDVEQGKDYWWCACGKSKSQPFCDGSHKGTEFTPIKYTASETKKKAVSVRFSGEGKRKVRVGYVVENPIWKTSYRLVLDKEGKPFLQGWAVVENPTIEDGHEIPVVQTGHCGIECTDSRKHEFGRLGDPGGFAGRIGLRAHLAQHVDD